MGTSNRYSPEVRERAVRMVFEHEREYRSQWATILSIASRIGCNPKTLRRWVRQAEYNQEYQPSQAANEHEQPKALEREKRELSLEPEYGFASENSGFLLKEVPLGLKRNNRTLFCRGKIKLDLIPRPNLYYSGDFLDIPREMLEDLDGFSFLENNHSVKGSLVGFRGNITADGKHNATINWRPESQLITTNRSDDIMMSAAKFHLFNFVNLIGPGRPINPNECIDFYIDEWRLQIKTLKETNDNIRYSKSDGGCRLTHVGGIQKEDGSYFSAQELMNYIQAFSCILSFTRGGQCEPVCILGYDTTGETVAEWFSPPGESWHGISSWLIHKNVGPLRDFFLCFMEKWKVDRWREVFRKAIPWYISANSFPLDTNAGIVLAQSAIELLSYEFVVEEKRLLIPDGFKKLWSSDTFRLLFSSLDIPLDIPKETPILRTFAKKKRYKWEDAPHALTDIRNSIVHRDHKRRDPLEEAHNEAWNLCLWYLEMSLLAICGYGGEYNDRLVKGIFPTVKDVPWAIK